MLCSGMGFQISAAWIVTLENFTAVKIEKAVAPCTGQFADEDRQEETSFSKLSSIDPKISKNSNP